jgi:SAM-dependent methyltransferase
MILHKIQHRSHTRFEDLYLALRRKENRLYTDRELIALPDVPAAHPHSGEWKLRRHSYHRLAEYLKYRNKPLSILEPGCGNGWLAAKLAWIPGSQVTGTDINLPELTQAKSVFYDIPNLNFLWGDIRDSILAGKKFDIILFASCIQYFPWLHQIVHTAFDHLAPEGEIHILDSPFYGANALGKARQRSREHFEKLGVPEMADCYFHHSYQSLASFTHSILYDPRKLISRWKHHHHPFPWIRIKKNTADVA